MRAKILLFTVFFFANINGVLACDNSSLSILSQVTNPNGSVTYTLDLVVELGGLDAPYYGSVLQFNSSTGTPTVVAGGFPSSIATVDLTLGTFGSDVLVGLIGSNVNSVVGDSDWNIYDNTTNVLSYEYGGIFGLTSNDFSTIISVTVMGCVESIVFDASVNSGTPACEFTVSTGVTCSASCGTCVAPTCNIAGPYSDNATADLGPNHCSQINNLSPSISGAVNDTSYHSVSTGTDGSLGIVISVGTTSGGSCTINRSALLYPVAPCSSGTGISPTGIGSSSFYNPEWTGLAANSSYIVEIVYQIPMACDLDDHCQSYYYPPVSNCGASSTMIWD